MPVWPKSFISFGASLLTGQMAVHLRRRDPRYRAQQKAYDSLVRRLAATAYWREAGIVPGMPYHEFRARVAPRTYDALVPAIERMQKGEADVLWPGQCILFAATAGTSTGTPKLLPVTTPMLRHFRDGCRDAMLHYTARVGHAGVFRGRHLFLTGSTELKRLDRADAAGRAYVGEWPAIAALNLPAWAERHTFEPGVEIAHMADWQAKMEATLARTERADISMIAGVPPWVLAFAEAMQARRAEEGHPVDTLQTCWPNLECFVHGGVPVSTYQPELRAALGSTVNFHEVYAAAEGVFAAQDGDSNGDIRLMSNLGLFFEFVPLADFDAAKIESLGPKAVPLDEVKAGINYVVLLTTPGGLARYLLGDIVRFSSVDHPRLAYVGRTSAQLSAFGEGVIEKEVTDALLAVCQRHGWSIVNFHVAPLLASGLTGQSRGRHEWWVELKPGTRETPTGPQMAVELDAELQRSNRDYLERRTSGRIDAPTVRLVMPGVFRHWLQFHGRWDGHSKIARCRSDRLIADELAQMTRFAHD